MAKIIAPNNAKALTVDGLEFFVWEGPEDAGGGLAFYVQFKYALPVKAVRGGVSPVGYSLKIDATDDEKNRYMSRWGTAMPRIKSVIADYIEAEEFGIATQAANKLLIKSM